jgi:patatin-related protein
MNGGVSLAVWMGGVTHELDLLRNASSRRPDEGGSPPGEVQQIWSEVLAAAGERVVIDVVSGTSAGGLNGVLLATAIARGRALPPLRDVWEKSASLTRLLEGVNTSSILNGGTFTAEVADAVDLIDRSERRVDNPVELLVTATALGGASFRYRDSFSNPFEVPDHRRLYQFRHGKRLKYIKDRNGWTFDQERHDEFRREHTDRLVLAARASASFPAAFPPVDGKRLEGCQLRRRPLFKEDTRCVMDGGVLNNAPFEPVLAAITGRGVGHDPVRRVLVYVVPSAGVRGTGPDDSDACDAIAIYKPPISALQYPTETNLRSSVEEMLTRLQGRARDMPSDLLARMWEQARGTETSPGRADLADHLPPTTLAVMSAAWSPKRATANTTAPTKTASDAISVQRARKPACPLGLPRLVVLRTRAPLFSPCTCM